MQVERDSSLDVIWIKPHLNQKGNLVKGHFRELNFVKPYKRRRPVLLSQIPVILAGQPELFEHTLINILRDVEPLMGY